MHHTCDVDVANELMNMETDVLPQVNGNNQVGTFNDNATWDDSLESSQVRSILAHLINTGMTINT